MYCDHASVMVFDMKESSKRKEEGGETVREETNPKERKKVPEDTKELVNAGGSRKSRKGLQFVILGRS